MAEIIESSSFSPIFYISIIVLILIIIGAVFLIKKGRGNFKPNLWKVIVSILATILWIVFLNYFANLAMCKMCAPPTCEADYGNWIIIKPTCDCACQSFSEMFFRNLLNILVPFALVYIIWSLFQKRKK